MKMPEPESLNGLSASEAAVRLSRSGYNELASAKPRNFLLIVFDVLREPMFLLLLACGAIYLLLGDWRDAAMLLAFVVIVLAISIVQRHKSERALDALKNLSSPRAHVIRDGVQQRIPGREVVVGDLVVLSEGDRVPADGVLLTCLNLQADESLLTGESVAAGKTAARDLPDVLPSPGGAESPYVYAGSLVVAGNGIAQIIATGSAQCDRQHRAFARRHRKRADAYRARNQSRRRARGDRWFAAECRGGIDLCAHARSLARWSARRHYAGDGGTAGRAARRADAVFRDRCVAHRAAARADAAHSRARNARFHHGVVRR